MGRWIPEECGKIVDDTGAFLGRANGDEEACALCEIHNTDRDVYEKRIAELEARLAAYQLYEGRIAEFGTLDYLFRSDSRASKIEDENNILRAKLARVRAESLRVVADGDPIKNYNVVRHKVVLYKGELWRASNIPYQLINICDEETIDPPENATVQPVRRLELWETEDGN